MSKTCTCAACISACKRTPGIPTPIEALKAIRAGHADDLMMVTRERDRRGWKWGRDLWPVLMPVSTPPSYMTEFRTINRHRRDEQYQAAGRCVFLNADDRCEIHDSGFKPTECRQALLCSLKKDRVHDDVAASWDSPVGRAVITIWKRHLPTAGE